MDETASPPWIIAGSTLWWSLGISATLTALFAVLSSTVSVVFVLAAWAAITVTAALSAAAVEHYAQRHHIVAATLFAAAGAILALPITGWAWTMEQDAGAESNIANTGLSMLLWISVAVSGLSVTALVAITVVSTLTVARLRRTE